MDGVDGVFKEEEDREMRGAVLAMVLFGCSASGLPIGVEPEPVAATPVELAPLTTSPVEPRPDMAEPCGGAGQRCCGMVCGDGLACAFADNSCSSGGICRNTQEAAQYYDYCPSGASCHRCG